jgi:hypothetical protein
MDVPARFSSGTLPSGGTIATGVGQGSPPFTVQFDSSSSGRQISVSADGGLSFVNVAPTYTSASAAMVIFSGPVSQFQFAGSSGDTYHIL